MTEIDYEPGAQPLPLEKTPHARIWSTGGRILAIVGVMGLLGLLGWGLYQVQKKPMEKGLAPDFTLTSFKGQTYTLSQLRGKVGIINFWASWCPPCREEAAYLEQTWRKYKDKGVIFIGVDYADAEKPALAYIKEFDITYFNGPDLGTRISQSYNIKGVPETIAREALNLAAHKLPIPTRFVSRQDVL